MSGLGEGGNTPRSGYVLCAQGKGARWPWSRVRHVRAKMLAKNLVASLLSSTEMRVSENIGGKGPRHADPRSVAAPGHGLGTRRRRRQRMLHRGTIPSAYGVSLPVSTRLQ